MGRKTNLWSSLNVLALLLMLCFSSCKQINSEIIPSVEFAPYISAFTGGVVSQTSPIRIELTRELPVVELNAEIKGKPFSFSPALNGKAYWVNRNTIEFVPEADELQPGKLYRGTFELGDYIEVEKGLQRFQFSFRVMERNFIVDKNSFFIHSSDPGKISIKGEISFSDVVDKSKIDRMFTAKSNTKHPLTARIGETDRSNTYTFAIENIEKEEKEYAIDLEINGKPLDIDYKVSKQIHVPATDRFQFLGANRMNKPGNGIKVMFSEPLTSPQNLEGLIEIEGVKTTLQIEDNVVNVFFEATQLNTLTLNIHAGVTGVSGKKLKEKTSIQFGSEAEKPQVQLISEGSILPDSKKLIVPFRAVNLYAVDLNVVRIYESNVLSFLQTNSLSSGDELRRSGRLVYKKTLRLDEYPGKNITRWEEYSIDLSELIKQEPGAIYRIMLSFKQAYSVYPCGGDAVSAKSTDASMTKLTLPDEEDDSVWDIPQSYYSMEYDGFNWSEYNWRDRDNPCTPSYYMDASRKVCCNLLSTNLGMIAKRNSANTFWIAVNNILDTKPMSNIIITAYNYQLHPIGTVKTNSEGFALLEPKGVPFVLVATDGKQKTYLKVIEGSENSTSRFDVGGKEIKKGLKGFVYGERGVWRPGDTLHISFILEDREKRIPDKHPVSLELYNPRGQFYSKQLSTNGLNGFYTFHLPTRSEDPTGIWNAYVKVGGTSFHKSLRIETIKPNRLKIDLKLPDEIIKGGAGNVNAVLSSSWFTGATTSNLKAKTEMRLTKVHTQFKNYDNYLFNNPATSFHSNDITVFDGALNHAGNANLSIKIPQAENAPGMLQANITTRVFEPGGDASIHTLSVPFSPFESYVGINLNQPDNRYIETDREHLFDVVTLDAKGKPTNRSNLEYKIYRVEWSWWWEKRDESFSSYINNSSITPVSKGTLQTVNGKAQFAFRIDYPEWGRYLVYVKDKDSGHATGGTIYVDWPESRGRSNKTDPSGITMLSFSLDKNSYEIGETVTATIPASSNGRALVAIENGSTVLHREWIQVTSSGDTKYQFKVTPEMAPNVYLHISLLQPHAQTVNDLPIRMYGVMPVFVVNKQTVIEPQLKMNDVLRPEKEFTLTVSEKKGRPMTYTVAIVDEGLLDLTNFKTPDPWNEFYSREALGIRTWDMFDDVIGAYTGAFSSLFSIGGDEMLIGNEAKANRFRPVVKYLGPFALKGGGSNTHNVQLPMYVGSVRTMVIAGQDGAYGKVEKTAPVRAPLMVLTTLPRVLSINEEVWVPVNVFAMEDGVKEVTVSVEASQNVKWLEGNKKSITFVQTGDQLVYFKAKIGANTGVETLKITALGGGHTAKETIEIDVRNPNPTVTFSESKVLQANADEELNYRLLNNSKASAVNLEVSRIPSIDFGRRFDYLYHYEHACTEQIVSKIFPLLYLTTFKEVSKAEQEQIKKQVREGIRQLYARQQSNGSFVYWPGHYLPNEWVTTYAGTLLLMAREKGYEVNENVIQKWLGYQRAAAQGWTPINRKSTEYYWQSDLQQAYRLYSLSLAGASELGAMNRMKEVAELGVQAKWRLAAAYAISGKANVANELVFNAQTTIEPYAFGNYVYGSSDRDEAMILETLVLLGKDKEALDQARKIAKNLSGQHYFSTQSTAFSLLAMGRLAEKFSGTLAVEWSLNDVKQPDVESAKIIYQTAIPIPPLSGKVKLKNNGNGAVYVDLISCTQLVNDTLPVIANNLRLTVNYVNMKGEPLQIHTLKQGADFMVVVKVENISGTSDYQDLALTHIIPSGWEVYNQGVTGGVSATTNYDYRDIRDDRVLTYFSLDRNRSKVFSIRLMATYAGSFTLPAVHCESMYNPLVQARTKAGNVRVER